MKYGSVRFAGRGCICVTAPVGKPHTTNVNGVIQKVPIEDYYKAQAARIPWAEYIEKKGVCAVVRRTR